jgi:hypothetical protein
MEKVSEEGEAPTEAVESMVMMVIHNYIKK